MTTSLHLYAKAVHIRDAFAFVFLFLSVNGHYWGVHNYVETSLDGRVHEMKTCCFNEHGSRE